ncbi:hypothetical protein BAUCODRAFT_129229 [Baudoinia panamericana UAMH 10762]|uniref:Zn(2)-C6 fungal-type domain-containing protein n=1 Tax=Baudoinia panamericana (strain UAMH 10762) TaxID=717646 RepID=M2LWC4_BAUPA|nr:uncharacterized protein BAUCODRAFT_129229 [Baudoinia panamericana UAMH 10762]EMC98962.1 hypothetical protein BAUCODRAFT_129229 [Baudoinia panamericana UAMH 10762]
MPTPNARSAWSCEQCRRRKVRCGRGDPCDHCVRRGEQCTWLISSRPQATESADSGQSPTVTQLQARIEHVEAILQHNGLLLPVGSPRAQVSVPSPRTAENEHVVRIEQLTGVSPENTLHSDVNTHDDFDHQIITTSPLSRRKQTRNGCSPTSSARPSAETLRALHILDIALPHRLKSDDLLESYLLRVEWIHHPLHVPTFKAEYDAFWQARSFPLESRSVPDLQWLALLMIILCLGSHFHETNANTDLEEKLYDASHELLTLSKFLANHSITVIQTLICMGLWLNNRGLSDTHHAQLALAIKMAANLGINKLDVKSGAAFAADDAAFFAKSIDRQSSDEVADLQIRHELQRRIWWSLVCQDFYTASSCNFTYFIHPKQSKTLLFANVDDEQLTNNPMGAVRCLSIDDCATASTYQLVKIPFARVAKAMVDLYNDDQLSYDAVLDLESMLWTYYAALPDYFKWRSPPVGLPTIPASRHAQPKQLEWQRLFLAFTVHNRVLRLHRPFMARGYSDTSMLHSRRATVGSAAACLELGEHGAQIEFPGMRWWVVLIHIFTAGIVFCIDYDYMIHHEHSRGHPEDDLRQERAGQVTLFRLREL